MRFNRTSDARLVALIAVLALASAAIGQDSYQTSFEEGTDTPTGWARAERGVWEESGGHTGRRCLRVTDDGTSSSLWRLKAGWLKPHQLYRYTFWYKITPGGDRPVARVGMNFANHDFTTARDWEEVSFVFQAPKDVSRSEIWFGEWRLTGKSYLDDLKIEPVGASFLQKDGIVLDESERIEKGAYLFNWKIAWQNSAYARVIQDIKVESRCNALRFWEPDNGYFIHRYSVPGYRQTSGVIKSTMNIVKGKCVIEAGTDAKTWREVAVLDKVAMGAQHEIALPKELFPASEIYLKASFPAEIQIATYSYKAELEGNPPDLVGRTEFFRGRLFVVGSGPLALRFEEGAKDLVSLATGGKTVGGVGAQIAQFTEKGKGYKGTGIGCAGPLAVKGLDVKERTPSKCVVEVVAESAEAKEGVSPCEARFRFTLYADQSWVEGRLLSIKNLGKGECTLKGYNLLLQPAEPDKAKAKCYGAWAAWVLEKASLVALSMAEGDFTLGLRTAADGPHGDITRPLDVRVGAGLAWEGNEPAIAFGVVHSAQDRDVFQEVKRVQPTLASPTPSGSLTYQEEKAETMAPPKEQK